jgi:predicted N-acetyltransferase YhbS
MVTLENSQISRLCEVPFFAPALAAAHAREWGHLYAGWDEAAALADFRQERPGGDPPTTWVIHRGSDTLLGSVSVVWDDLPGHPDLNPWLASLFVFPKFRGRGLGKLLVRHALDFLAAHHHPHAYLFTEDQVPFFSKFGFAVHAKTSAQGNEVTIMKWTNPDPAAAAQKIADWR